MIESRRLTLSLLLASLTLGYIACKPAADNSQAKPSTAAAGTTTVSCPSKQWVKASNGVEVNYAHIFCGEMNNKGRVVGFHARPQGNNPSTVAKVRITQQPNPQGIYAGQWELVGKQGEDKFSTFYPDHCTPTQVINSIGYAARNQQDCPRSAPQWAWCGANAPQDATGDYCRSADGTPFLIAGASSPRGGVNTAFPLR